MKSIYAMIITGVLLFAGISSAPAQKNPADLSFPEINFKPPEAKRAVLSNGIVLYLMEDHELPLFSGYAMLRCGELWVPAEKAGLAGLTGTVLRTGGTKSKSGDEIDEELEFISGSIETSIGADAATASISVLKDDIERGLELFAEILMSPRFSEDKIQLAKMQALESYRRRNDDPTNILNREFSKTLFGADSPYGRETTDTSIEAVTREDMVQFHRNYFHPNNMILGVAGDFKTAEMIKLLEMVFKGWGKAKLDLAGAPKTAANTPAGVYIVEKEINQSNVAMGHYGITRNSPDYHAVQVMNEILSFQRLFFKIRTDKGWAYQVGSQFLFNSAGGVFKTVMKTKAESTHEAMKLMKELLEEIRTEPVTDKELKQAKDSYLNSYVFRFSSAAQVVDQKVTLEFNGYPKDFLETFTDKIQKVTKEDVLQAARKYVHPDKLLMVVVGDPTSFDAPLDPLGKITQIPVE